MKRQTCKTRPQSKFSPGSVIYPRVRLAELDPDLNELEQDIASLHKTAHKLATSQNHGRIGYDFRQRAEETPPTLANTRHCHCHRKCAQEQRPKAFAKVSTCCKKPLSFAKFLVCGTSHGISQNPSVAVRRRPSHRPIRGNSCAR